MEKNIYRDHWSVCRHCHCQQTIYIQIFHHYDQKCRNAVECSTMKLEAVCSIETGLSSQSMQ